MSAAPPAVLELPSCSAKEHPLAHRIVEIVIGRLITDEQFRTAFLEDPVGTLSDLSGRGLELTPLEIAAIAATESGVWSRAAERLDPRLQKASLNNPS
jgi:hypothetical protein